MHDEDHTFEELSPMYATVARPRFIERESSVDSEGTSGDEDEESSGDEDEESSGSENKSSLEAE